MKNCTYYRRMYWELPDDIIEVSPSGKTYKMIWEVDEFNNWKTLESGHITGVFETHTTLDMRWKKYDSKEEMLADMFVELL